MKKSATSIELDSDTANALEDYAASVGLTAQDFLKRRFGAANGTHPMADVDAWLDELSDGFPAAAPLPRDFSTKDIYADHD